MDSHMLVWWMMAAAAVVCAVGMIAVKNPVHSALLLVGNFVAVAVIYLLLSAPMLFAIQLIVYAGAIMVLFLFVIMFFMAPKARQWQRPPLRGQLILGGVLVVGFMLVLFISLSTSQIGNTEPPAQVVASGTTDPYTVKQFTAQGDPIDTLGQPRALGIWMFGYHVLPFNVIGLLLLAALVGAVLVGRDRTSEGRSHVPEFASHIDRVLPRSPQAGAAPGPAAPEPEEVQV